MRRFFLILFCALIVIEGCAHLPVSRPQDALEPVSWWRVEPADDLEFNGLQDALRRSLEFYRTLPQNTIFYFGAVEATAADMAETLQTFLLIIEDSSLTYAQKIRKIKSDFDVYRSVGADNDGNVLFTGYYEPVLSCRTSADDRYKYPLYKRPEDIIEVDLSFFGNGFPVNRLFGRIEGKRLVPYYSREDIDHQKTIANRGLEILWCNDLVDIYFLQIQGSGKADLGNGEIVSVLYDGQNGRPYRSIGRLLMELGAIKPEDMSMQAIRRYLRDNPEKVAEILNYNPSYVFFKIGTGPSIGSIGVPLTPGRSIATDMRLFPKAGLALIKTEKPVLENGDIKEWKPFTRFVLNQDTGGAIKGAGRVDLFWGQGPEAEIASGYMQQEGELYFLLKKK